MNNSPYRMGQTKEDDFASSAGSSSHPPNFSFQAKTKSTNMASGQSPCRNNRSPHKEQSGSGRPSTPFPENEVQFLPNVNDADAPPVMVHRASSSGDSVYPGTPHSATAAPPLNSSSHCFQGDPQAHGHSLMGQQHQQQQQSWQPTHLCFGQSPEQNNGGGVNGMNPAAALPRTASCLATQQPPTAAAASSVEKDERVPNSAVRRSRVWKYGRRSSGNQSDRQPFTFSVSSPQAGAMTNMESRGNMFFGKRSLSSASNEEPWSYEPSHKQFISEERMMAEMNNLSLDGFPRQPLFPLPPTSPPLHLPPSPPLHHHHHPPSPPLHLPHSPPPILPLGSPSTSCGHSHTHSHSHSHHNHSQSSHLLRHHHCNRVPQTHHQAVMSNTARRLDDDSDDEGVEEDMPPQAEGQRLEMTPEFMTALKIKGAANHLLPDEIAKKIATSPCMELVLWRPPPSLLNPEGGRETPCPPSPSSPGGSELAPIMEVELERERAEARSLEAPPNHLYGNGPAADGMQEEILPDFDEDMDL